MKYIIEKVTPIPEGKYSGTIKEVINPTEKDEFQYTRYMVNLELEDSPTLNLSFPSRITYLNDGTPSSQHAVFLSKMGMKLEFDKDAGEFISNMAGKKISCLVQQKVTTKGTFSEIVKDSVKTL